jgi:Holliday junction resolvase RusA-like endonuclease
MPYIGGILSVNSYKVKIKGRAVGPTKPEVRSWMLDLATKVLPYRGKLSAPITVKVFGKFRDNRQPDLDNLYKVIMDPLKEGLDIDDRYFIPVSEGYELGHEDQSLVITLEDKNEGSIPE